MINTNSKTISVTFSVSKIEFYGKFETIESNALVAPGNSDNCVRLWLKLGHIDRNISNEREALLSVPNKTENIIFSEAAIKLFPNSPKNHHCFVAITFTSTLYILTDTQLNDEQWTLKNRTSYYSKICFRSSKTNNQKLFKTINNKQITNFSDARTIWIMKFWVLNKFAMIFSGFREWKSVYDLNIVRKRL